MLSDDNQEQDLLSGVCQTCKHVVTVKRDQALLPQRGPVQDRYKGEPFGDLMAVECPWCVEHSPSKTGPKVFLAPVVPPGPHIDRVRALPDEERDIALGYGKRATLTELCENTGSSPGSLWQKGGKK